MAQLESETARCSCCEREKSVRNWDALYDVCDDCAWCWSLHLGEDTHEDASCHHGECRTAVTAPARSGKTRRSRPPGVPQTAPAPAYPAEVISLGLNRAAFADISASQHPPAVPRPRRSKLARRVARGRGERSWTR